MAIAKTVQNPFGVDSIHAHIRLIEGTLNHADQEGRFVFGVYESSAAWAAGKPPMAQISYPILSVPQPAEYDKSGVLVRDAIPSYMQILMAHASLYSAEKAAIYATFIGQPELAGGIEV